MRFEPLRRLSLMPWMLALAWIAALVLIRPVGDFPLGDDWGYGSGARLLAATGALEYPPGQASMLVHVLWGGLAVVLAGHFSFEVLRISTLALTVVGAVATWKLTREIGGSPGDSAFGTALFVANPVVLLLSATFMTDVPFAAWSAVAALCLTRALKQPSARRVAAAAVFSAAAILIRQFGLFLPVMFAPAFLLAWGISRRSLVIAVVPAAVALGAWQGHTVWMDLTHHLPADYEVFLKSSAIMTSPASLFTWVAQAKRVPNILFHLSWYLLPAVLWTARRPSTRAERWTLGLTVGGALALVLASGKVAPWGSSWLFDIGVGPAMLFDGGLPTAPIPRAPRMVWTLWTLAAAAGFAVLLVRVAAWLRRAWTERTSSDRRHHAIVLMLVGAGVLSIGAMVVLQFYDRYLIPLIPWLIAVLVMTGAAEHGARQRWTRVMGVTLVGLYAVFGVLAAHDYFEWNRARWRALTPLITSGEFPLASIEGGFEFNRGYAGKMNFLDDTASPPRVVVTFGDRPGFVRCAEFPYRRWMPPTRDRLLLLVPAGTACPAR